MRFFQFSVRKSWGTSESRVWASTQLLMTKNVLEYDQGISTERS